MDPITDILQKMHVIAFGQRRLEATAPWGLIQERQSKEKVSSSGKRNFPTDLAHFAMLARGNCWLSVEGIAEPIPLTDVRSHGTTVRVFPPLKTKYEI